MLTVEGRNTQEGMSYCFVTRSDGILQYDFRFTFTFLHCHRTTACCRCRHAVAAGDLAGATGTTTRTAPATSCNGQRHQHRPARSRRGDHSLNLSFHPWAWGPEFPKPQAHETLRTAADLQAVRCPDCRIPHMLCLRSTVQ